MTSEINVQNISFSELRNKVFKLYLSELFSENQNNILFNFSKLGASNEETGSFLLAIRDKKIVCAIANLDFILKDEFLDLTKYSIMTFATNIEMLEVCKDIILNEPYVSCIWMTDNFLLIDSEKKIIDEKLKKEIDERLNIN